MGNENMQEAEERIADQEYKLMLEDPRKDGYDSHDFARILDIDVNQAYSAVCYLSINFRAKTIGPLYADSPEYNKWVAVPA